MSSWCPMVPKPRGYLHHIWAESTPFIYGLSILPIELLAQMQNPPIHPSLQKGVRGTVGSSGEEARNRGHPW